MGQKTHRGRETKRKTNRYHREEKERKVGTRAEAERHSHALREREMPHRRAEYTETSETRTDNKVEAQTQVLFRSSPLDNVKDKVRCASNLTQASLSHWDD